MADTPESIMHPVFGKMIWNPHYRFWSASVQQTAGSELELILDPNEEEPQSFLASATELYFRTMENERRLLQEAVQKELLELYNDCWRQDEILLTSGEFISRLKLTLLENRHDLSHCTPL